MSLSVVWTSAEMVRMWHRLADCSKHYSSSNWKDTATDSGQADGLNVKLSRRSRSQPSSVKHVTNTSELHETQGTTAPYLAGHDMSAWLPWRWSALGREASGGWSVHRWCAQIVSSWQWVLLQHYLTDCRRWIRLAGKLISRLLQ